MSVHVLATAIFMFPRERLVLAFNAQTLKTDHA
jgi:hypothetical protein